MLFRLLFLVIHFMFEGDTYPLQNKLQVEGEPSKEAQKGGKQTKCEIKQWRNVTRGGKHSPLLPDPVSQTIYAM